MGRDVEELRRCMQMKMTLTALFSVRVSMSIASMILLNTV